MGFNNKQDVMHREDKSNYLLFIEPKIEQKSVVPVNDELVKIMRIALNDAVKGSSSYSNLTDTGTFTIGNAYRGVHHNCDGVASDNQDYALGNGMITNSLAVHYLTWFRDAIPESEFAKLRDLEKFYGKSTIKLDF